MPLSANTKEQREDARRVLKDIATTRSYDPAVRVQAATALLQDIIAEEVTSA